VSTIRRPAEVTEEQARSIAAVAEDVIDHAVPIVELMGHRRGASFG
jgi:hypothetical protein